MAGMAFESRHLSIFIERATAEVYDYVSNPANLPAWAPGLCTSVEQVDGRWYAESPLGRVAVIFAPGNDFGVLDHEVTVPSGETYYNPVRVIANDDTSELIFTVRRLPDASEADFARDIEAVAADLARLRQLLEQA
jgi:hypothetical protein